jgi:hypothetical protein
MTQVRIRDTGEVLSTRQFRARHPNTSFPPVLDANTLDAYGADPVLPSPKPSTDRLTVAYRDGVVQDANGNWVEAWNTKDRNITLDAFKTERRQEATEQFRQHRKAGTSVTIGGQAVVIETDSDAQLELARVAERLAGTSNTLNVVTRRGAKLTLDATTAAAARDAAAAYYEACVTREYELHDEIDRQTSKRGVADIDVTSGWPS